MAAPKKWVYWLAAALWVIVSLPVGYAVGHNTRASAAQFAQPVTVVQEQAFPGAEILHVGRGTWAVPAEAPPGSYQVTATGNTFGCSWWRLKANDDRLKSVIDSGTVSRGGLGEITVDPGDKFLKLSGDCTWARS